MKCVSLGLCICFWCCCLLNPLLVLGQIQPVVKREEGNQYILYFVKSLERLTNFRNIITFFGNGEFGNKAFLAVSIEQRLLETFGCPVIVAGTQTDPLDDLIGNRNVALVLFNGINDPMLSAVHSTLKNLNTMVITFLYKSDDDLPPTSDFMHAFFTWCWNKNFRFAQLIVKSSYEYETWSYEYKTTVNLIRVSEWMIRNRNIGDYRTFGNMNQYRTSVAVFQSIPDAFVYNSSKQHDLTGSNISLGGQTGLLLVEYMRYANGTMQIVPLTRRDYFQKNSTQKADIGASLVWNFSIATYSPLVISTRTCIVIPYTRSVSVQKYFFNFHNWSFGAFIAFYLSTNGIIMRLANPGMSLGMLLLRTLKLSMGQPITCRAFRCLSLPEKFIEIFTQLYNLLMASIFCGSLTMALTIGLHKPEIVDVASFLASGLRIMAFEHQLLHFEYNQDFEPLGKSLLIVDENIRNQHLYALNNSYAYFMESHRWVQLKFLQRRLRQPKLKLAPEQLCDVHRHLRLDVRPELAFMHVLKHFVDQARETGLIEKWMRMGLQQAQFSGLISQAPYDPPVKHPLPLEFFETGLMIYGFGIALSLLIFLLECVYIFWWARRHIRNTAIII